MSDVSIEQEAFLNRLGEELGQDGIELVFGADSDTRAIYTASVLDKYDHHVSHSQGDIPVGTLAAAMVVLRGEERISGRDRGIRKIDKWMRSGSIGNLLDKYIDKISSDEVAFRRIHIYSGLEEAPEILVTDAGVEVVELTTHKDMVRESDVQNHCIGLSRNYSEKLLEGENRFFSVRHPDGIRFTMSINVSKGQVDEIHGKNDTKLSLLRHEQAEDCLRAIGETLVVVEDEMGIGLEFPSYIVAGLGNRHYLMTKNGIILFPDRRGFTANQLMLAENEGVRAGKLSIARLQDERLRSVALGSQSLDVGLSGMATQQQLEQALPSGTALNGTLSIERCEPVALPSNLSVRNLFSLNDSGLTEWRNDTRISGTARIDASNLRYIEGLEGVAGRISFNDMPDGLLPEFVTAGDVVITGPEVTQLPQSMKARRIELNTRNVSNLGFVECDHLNVKSIEMLDGIDPSSKIGTLHISSKTILRWLESGYKIPAVFNRIKVAHFEEINTLVGLLLERAGITCSVEPSV